jgi:hypothetical protein
LDLESKVDRFANRRFCRPASSETELSILKTHEVSTRVADLKSRAGAVLSSTALHFSQKLLLSEVDPVRSMNPVRRNIECGFTLAVF